MNPLTAAIAPVLASPAHFSFGAVTPAASLLPTFDPRLTQTSVKWRLFMVSAGSRYPYVYEID